MPSNTAVDLPGALPVSLGDVKTHSRIDHTDEDAYLTQLIKAASTYVQQRTRRALISQVWDYRLDYFPRVIELPLTPVQSVDLIEYIDDAGVTQTLSTSLYQVDLFSAPAQVCPAYGQVWPNLRGETLNAVRVRYTAGVSSPSLVDKDLRIALLMLIDHWYEHRSAVTELRGVVELPIGLEAILRPLRVW